MLANFVVTSVDDGPVAAAGQAPGTLRQAVFDANALPGTDTITFDPTVFTGGLASFIRLTEGELRVTESLTIDASGGVDVIVSGDAAGDDAVDSEGITNPFATFSGTSGFSPDRLRNNSRLFNFESESGEINEGDLTLVRLTLTGGAADRGGGIRFVSSGSLELNHAAVSGNWAEFGGGGVQIVTGSALLRDSVVSQNWTTAPDAPGGGISAPDENGTVAFIDSLVSGNRTGKVLGNRLIGRDANGAGIYAANLLLERSVVEGNDAGVANGGGVWAGNLVMRQSTVHDNEAYRSGAAIYADQAVIETSTISGNRTGFSPGGIYVASSLVLKDSTVTDNEAGTGGGIYFADSAGTQAIDIHNSIVAGNRDRNAADGEVPDLWSGPGIIPSVTHSLIGETTGSNVDSSTGMGNLLNIDPLLEPLADNGGPTPTHAIPLTSPAVDAGRSDLTTDQRGIPRPNDWASFNNNLGDGSDIGAFELPATASRFVSLPSEYTIFNSQYSTIELPQLRFVDDSLTTTIVTVTASAGTLGSPPDGTTVGGGVSATLVSPQVITLAGTLGDINKYLSERTWLRYQPVEDIIGFGAASLSFELDSEAAGTLSINLAELPSFVVSTSADEVNQYDNVTSLREAITLANAAPGPDTITFDPTFFTGGTASFIRLTEGELEVTETLTIDASMAVGVTFSGDALANDITDEAGLTDVTGSGSTRLEDNSQVLSSLAGDLTLNSATVTGGRSGFDSLNVPSNPISFASGGGINFRSDGTLRLLGSTLIGNSTFGHHVTGGAIFVDRGNLIVIDSELAGNHTGQGIFAHGGAIYSDQGDTLIVGTRFHDNHTTSSSSHGGAVFSGAGAVTIEDSHFVANTADGNGGGVGLDAGSLAISNSTLTANAGQGSGGALHSNTGDLVVTTTTIRGNNSHRNGAGVATQEGSLAIVDSLIAENVAGPSSLGRAGGVYTNRGVVYVETSTISSNAAYSAAGIYVENDGALQIKSSTVVNNIADLFGGGIVAPRITSNNENIIENSVVAGNRDAGSAPDLSVKLSELQRLNHTLIGNATGSSVDENTGIGNLWDLDPRLGPLADNGGPTLTHLPAGDSPLLDVGSSTLPADQRGLPRLFEIVSLPNGPGDGTDIGAVERQSVPPTRLQASVTAAYERLSELDFSETLIVDETTESLTVSLSVTEGTFAMPADGADVGAGIMAELASPQVVTLVGSPLDINQYLRVPSNLRYTPASGAVGPTAAAINVSVDSVVIGSINVSVTEALGLVVDIASDVPNPYDRRTSLRDAISLANTTPGHQTITFDPAVFTGGEASFIRLVQGELLITDSLTIDASMAEGVTVSGDALGDDITDEHGITDAAASYGDDAGDPDDLLDDNSRVINYDGQEGDLSITRLTITGGRTHDGYISEDDSPSGGGIRFSSSGEFTLTDGQVMGNSVAADHGSGGGLFLVAGGVHLQGSTIAGNHVLRSAGQGGGGVFAAAPDTLIVSSTITGNHSHRGAGSGLFAPLGSVTVLSSTITRNTVGNLLNPFEIGGVALGPEGVLTVTNSLIAGNDTIDWAIDRFSGDIVASHSLLGEPTEDFMDAEAFGPDVLLNVEPVLGPLADNGGPTQTHLPLITGRAINRGTSTDAPATDQRGLPRNVNGVDIGAVERQEPIEFPELIVSTTLDTNDGDLSPGNFSLREAIVLANARPGPDTITFDSSFFTGGAESYIRLTEGELEITGSLTIDGSAAIGLILSGDVEANDFTDDAGITDAVASTRLPEGFTGHRLSDNTRLLNYSATEGDLTLRRLTLTGGRTVGIEDEAESALYSGAGVRFMSDGTLGVFESTVSGNSLEEPRFESGLAGSGGGVFVATGALLIDRSTISGNLANHDASFFSDGGHGGGIAAWGPSTRIRNSTISGNVAAENQGAGLHTTSDTIEITHSTITRNLGTGVFIAIGSEDQHASVDGSIIGNNYNEADSPFRARSDVLINNTADLSFNKSLISRNFQRFDFVFSTIVEESAGAGNLLNVDPLLGPLADNGGPTKTHAPTLGSPVIDAALSTEATDQRGLARTVDLGGYADSPDSDGTDMGSHEADVEPTYLIGDYNGDYRVDAADYTVWRDSIGSIVAPMSGADGDGDGRVTTFDHTVWSRRYGVQATPPSAPTSTQQILALAREPAERPAAPINEAFKQFAVTSDSSGTAEVAVVSRRVRNALPRDASLLLFEIDSQEEPAEQEPLARRSEDQLDDYNEDEALAAVFGDWD